MITVLPIFGHNCHYLNPSESENATEILADPDWLHKRMGYVSMFREGVESLPNVEVSERKKDFLHSIIN